MGLFSQIEVAEVLIGADRIEAQNIIRENHYTHSTPSGKSHYVRYRDALIVWSIPANKNLSRFILGWDANVWELSRLWAPDGHERNLLTRAISAGVRLIVEIEKPDLLISYADPNVGHHGGVYKAASWLSAGQSGEARYYRSSDGKVVARRAFHSGKRSLTKAEIEALGYEELKMPGKIRFVRPITKKARAVVGSLPWSRRLNV